MADLDELASISRRLHRRGEQEAAQGKQDVPEETKRPDPDRDGSPRQTQGSESGPHREKDESGADSGQRAVDAHDNP